MNVLGVSAFYHDASAALISHGRLVAAAAEERYSRQKHDPSFPKFAIEQCLAQAGLVAQDLDRVVFYEEPHTKFTRVLASVLSAYPASAGTFVRSMKDWMRAKLWLKHEISRRLDIAPRKVLFCPHHLSHAYQAFVGSPYDEAAILTVDAVGEWACTGLFHGRKGRASEIKALQAVPYPHSLGLLYSAFTAFLGFRPNDGESSVMALASFGEPRYLDAVRRILRIQHDGTYEIDQSYLSPFGAMPFTKKLVALFGQPRSFKAKLPFSTLRPAAAISGDDQRYADIAASIQRAIEDALLALVAALRRMSGADKLCLAGGVALNCVANSALLRSGLFRDLYIPPDPGDGGAALGAAAYGAFGEGGGGGLRIGPYLGSSYDETADMRMVPHLRTETWEPYRLPSSSPLNGARLQTTTHASVALLVAEIVDDLRRGRIVGWFQDRFELGPRALGNRSILADPSRIDVALRMSGAVKLRAEFRPYAFSIASEDAPRVMEVGETLPHPARWMQMIAGIKPEAIDSVKAAVHVDGTSRVQVCSAEDNPCFHRLLTAFGQASGLAALLNTSFNEAGYPMVATPAEALLMFARTDLDVLVLNRSVVRKVPT